MKFLLSCILLITGLGLGRAQNLLNSVDFGASFPHNSRSHIVSCSNGDFVHFDLLYEEVDIDMGPGSQLLNGSDPSGMVLSRFTADGSLVWTNFLPNTPSDFYDLIRTVNEDFIVCGTFNGIVDFDLSENESTLDSGPDGAMFISSYASDGSLNWTRQIQNTSPNSYLTAHALSSDSSGNCVITGYFSQTVDFDPGENVNPLTSYDSDIDGFVLKLDNNGDFVFANAFGGEMHDYIKEVDIDNQNNLIVKGVTRSFVDVDPGPGEYVLSTAGTSEETFIAKFLPNGSFVWAFLLATNASNSIESELLLTDNEGNVVVGGLSYGYCDFDPGIGSAVLSGDEIFWYLAKYGPDGAFSWLKSGLGATPICGAMDFEGNVYLSGIAGNTSDLDGGIGSYHPGNNDESVDLYCAKYNYDGELVWGFGLTGSDFVGASWTTDLEVDFNNNLMVAGLYQGNLDIDPGDGIHILNSLPSTWPLFVATYDQGICSNTSMIITEASNLDCLDNSGTVSAIFTNGQVPFTYLWNTGETTATIEAMQPGVYTILGMDANGCTVDREVIVSGPVTLDNFDLSPNAILPAFVPGFDSHIQLDAFNNGCGLASGSLSLSLDPLLTLLNADPAPNTISDNVLTWFFENISYDSEHLTPVVSVHVPASTALGTLVNLVVEMTPVSGDYYSDDNHKIYTGEVVGAFDPNMIEVFPQGIGIEGFVQNNQTLTYTIRFQNTGTAPAVNVNVLNEIDPDLDINSVQVIASSHAMHTEMVNDDALRFVFNNIMLPDSVSNEPASHGYVVYTIEQNPNLTPYTQIENTAAIYFDFNSPVVTNTVINTIEGPNFTSELNEINEALLFPNPSSSSITIQLRNLKNRNIRIVGMDGKILDSFRAWQDQIVYDLRALDAGIYDVQITDESGDSLHRRFVKK